MKKIVFLGLLTLTFLPLFGQYYFNGSLQGSNYKYLGLNAEVEKQLNIKTIVKNNKNGKERVKSREVLAFTNLGFYANSNSHLGIINTYGIKYQKLTKSTFYYNAGLGFGFNTNFLGETYEVVNSTVERKVLNSVSYFCPQFQLSVGRQFKNSKYLDALFIRQNIHYLLSYNYANLPIFNLEIGARFTISQAK